MSFCFLIDPIISFRQEWFVCSVLARLLLYIHNQKLSDRGANHASLSLVAVLQ